VLQALFGKVVVPPAVVIELLARRDLFPKAGAAVACFKVTQPEDRMLIRGFRVPAQAGAG
jgi:predicted nucleic acid-binding protein